MTLPKPRTSLLILLLTGGLLAMGACQRRAVLPVSQESTQSSRYKHPYDQAFRFGEEAGSTDALAFVPVVPEHHPLITIRLAMHVFQDEQGKHNFQDTPEHRAILQSFVNHLNSLFSNLAPHDPPVDPVHVPDSRIRFRLEEIHFYRDQRGYDMADDVCGPYYVCGPDLYRQFVTENIRLSAEQKEGRLHILMGEHPYEDKRFQAGGSASGLGSKKFILSRGYYWYYFFHPHLEWARDYVAGNIAHELGHSLGLSHTFEGNVCTGSGQGLPLAQGSSNNLMDYGSWRSLTPCQIGTMRRSIENNVGDLQDIQVPDYCLADAGAGVTIRAGEDILWASPRRLPGDLIIEQGARLTVQARLGMPAGGRIIVRKGGWLVLENATLGGNCGQAWDELKIEGNSRRAKRFTAAGFPLNHGRVDLR